MVAYHHLVPLGAGFMMPAAMDGIEGDEVCQRGGIAGRVIDAHKLHIRPVEGGAKRETAHAAKTVDTNFDSHAVFLNRRMSSGY